ncbi:hypothetical protein EJ05DRAFT_503373 [Pseudovirgaria hyperparasitica]|uniref:Uncharacterized protein n=1 Tax=Pseudovirgaria hyperparasitica TaxID=470096 RepID=A0A6A6VYV8_9PEZI|nr:uncharacterized protein EJ05DRAFT_503373 [Pseudovirgaria hyperparasitica]KAF2755059.1 hypothetical protein EJ05DRAFT_503373 [Pseudovirgaria hyperparasitica]
MAVVRDPAFWKRFSTAVHLDDMSRAEKSQLPNRERSDSWLERQNAKKSRRTVICFVFWICFLAVAAGIVVILVWLNATGRLAKDKNAT